MVTGSIFGGNNYYWSSYSGSYGSGSTGSTGSSVNEVNYAARYLKQNYASTIAEIKSDVRDGDYEDALRAIEELKGYVGDYNGGLDDGQVATVLYKCGVNYSNYESDAAGSFATGLANGIPLIGLFNDAYSQEEIKAALNGRETKPVDVAKEVAGQTISGAASGAAVGAAVGTFTCGPLLGTAIGAVVGAGVGILQNVIRDKVNKA